MSVQTALPPQDLPRSSEDLTRLASTVGPLVVTLDTGILINLPAELSEILRSAAAAMATGQAVTVQSVRTVLSTQEVAELLGVTRPTVVRLLDSGQIPFSKPGGKHRRVQLSHVLAYQQQIRDDRRLAILENAADATDQELFVTGFVETR